MPFSSREPALRVVAALRWAGIGPAPEDGSGAAIWHCESKLLEREWAAHRAGAEGRELHLTAAEWKILTHLATNAGVVVARECLLGENLSYLVAEGSERTVDAHVKYLRVELGDPGWIETVRGFGYRFAGSRSGQGDERGTPR